MLSATAMYAVGRAIATFFDDPLVEGMMHWLALASLLTAAAGPATCLLQRDLNFRALGLIGLAGYAVGYLGVGVPMALAGYGRLCAGGCLRGAGGRDAGCVLCGQASSGASAVLARGRPRGADDRPHGIPHQHRELAARQSRSRRARAGAQRPRRRAVTVAYNLARFPTCCCSARCSRRSWRRGRSCRTIASGWRRAGCWDWPACWCCSRRRRWCSRCCRRTSCACCMDRPGWTRPGSWPCCSCACRRGPAGVSDTGAVEHRPQAPGVPAAAAAARPRGCRPGGCWRRRASAAIAIVSAIVIFARAFVIITAALRALGLRWSAMSSLCRPRPRSCRRCARSRCWPASTRGRARRSRAQSLYAGALAPGGHAADRARRGRKCWALETLSALARLFRVRRAVGAAAADRRFERTRAMTTRPTGFLHWALSGDAGPGGADVLLSGRDLSQLLPNSSSGRRGRAAIPIILEPSGSCHCSCWRSRPSVSSAHIVLAQAAALDGPALALPVYWLCHRGVARRVSGRIRDVVARIPLPAGHRPARPCWSTPGIARAWSTARAPRCSCSAGERDPGAAAALHGAGHDLQRRACCRACRAWAASRRIRWRWACSRRPACCACGCRPFARRWLNRLAWLIGLGGAVPCAVQDRMGRLRDLFAWCMLAVRNGPGVWRRLGDPRQGRVRHRLLPRRDRLAWPP